MENRLINTRLIICSLAILCLSLVISPQWTFSASNPENYLTIREIEGKTTANYPVQIGRPFVQGEIVNYPQAIINGNPILTQADVKTRWADGSVKHAVISFLVSELPANSTLTVTFQNQMSGNNTGFLDQEGMLSSPFNFDASMDITNDAGATASASARKMVQDGNFEYWLKGPVLTSVILADHSEGRVYDLGFDSYRSFRPIFHATFWPGINKVRVRYIGEVSNTEAIQDMVYSLALKLGYTSPSPVYSKSTFTHYAASRWTKDFWLGGAPSDIAINHNLAYLAKTKLVPNYDVSKVVPESIIASEYTTWANAAKDLYDPGLWSKAMGNAGGRRDIGPYPAWTVRWLYSGDKRMEKMSFGHADLAAAWPMHFREGDSVKYFDKQNTVAGIGRSISIVARPTIILGANNAYINNSSTKPEDKITPVGSFTNGGWAPDCAHQPDAFSPQYMLTGDFWYLEQMYFWASWSAAKSNGAATMYAYGRGPTGAEGGIPDEIRGQAWAFRSRVHTGSLAPDNTTEKSYFTTLIDDAIAIWEGMRNITGSRFQGNANWNWGYSMIGQAFLALGSPPLHHWSIGGTGFVQEPMDTNIVKVATSPWEQNFLMFAIGRGKELGYPTDALLGWFSVHLINQLTNPDYIPYLVSAYRIPTVRKSDSLYFSSWSDLKAGFQSSFDPVAQFNNSVKTDAEHGYAYIAFCATSMVADQPGGAQAWAWMKERVLSSSLLSSNPKWAILPRDLGNQPDLVGPAPPKNVVIIK